MAHRACYLTRDPRENVKRLSEEMRYQCKLGQSEPGPVTSDYLAEIEDQCRVLIRGLASAIAQDEQDARDAQEDEEGTGRADPANATYYADQDRVSALQDLHEGAR